MMIGGNENNLDFIKQNHESVKQLAKLAYDLDILIHIEGIPFGKSETYKKLCLDLDD